MVKKDKKIQKNKGMTYVELIVVLSIFAVLSSVAVFNYGAFQDRVDIKNLASDITLQIVQAQKASLSGLLPASFPLNWKPSYGVYFSTSSQNGADNKNFIYFVDLDSSGTLSAGETLNTLSITKNNSISRLDVFYQNGTDTTTGPSLNDLTVSFSRPNSGAVIKSSALLIDVVSYAQVTITSPSGAISKIKLYSSGRVQVN